MQVTINGRILDQQITEMMRYSQKMAVLVSEIESIKITTASQSGSGQSIMSKWKQITADSMAHSAALQKLHSTLDEIQAEYLTCESRLCGQKLEKSTYEKESGIITTTTSISETENSLEVNWKPLLKVMGEFGTVGGVASSLFGMVDDPTSIGKNLPKLVGYAAKTAAKIADGKTIDIWGKSTVDAIGFRENLAMKLDGYIVNNSYNSANSSVAAKNAANISAATKWCGVAITGMLNFADNVEEYNADFSNPRLYAETIGETVVDIGASLLIGAGVAAAAGASAPVWAVGVVTTGVVMGLDWVSETAFGADLSEVISDTVIELAKETGAQLQKKLLEVGSAVKTTAKSIKAGWKKLTSWF